MSEYEQKQSFVRDYLSPLLAAAKNSKYSTWSCEYMSGAEAEEKYPRWDEPHLKYYDECIVVTVMDRAGNPYRYYINVSADSLCCIADEVINRMVCK